MATLTIRNLDEDLKARLCLRATLHGHSMEEEVRNILRTALSWDAAPVAGAVLINAIRARMAPFGDIELQLPSRTQMPDPPHFSDAGFDR